MEIDISREGLNTRVFNFIAIFLQEFQKPANVALNLEHG